MNINFFATTFGLIGWVGDKILEKIFSFLVFVDSVIYNFIRYVYEIFITLTKVNLFGVEDYKELVNRIYVILGLIMLFILAYSLLKAVINPDNFAKGELSFPKLIQNVVVSLVIIAFLPTVFELAFNVQNSLLNKGTVSSLILGTNTSSNDSDKKTYSLNNAGNLFAYETFKGFYGPDSAKCQDLGETDEDKCRDAIEANGTTLGEVDRLVNPDSDEQRGESFAQYMKFSELAADGYAGFHYYFPLSTIAGIYVLYLMINFCFDIALRSVKLAFYQIIAPIPVICRVIPGGKLKDVFSKWLQQVIGLFIEVFVRIGAMSFGVLMLNLLKDNLSKIDTNALSFTQTGLLYAFIVMAMVMFIKKIPEVLSKIFPFDTSGMKLGIREKLAAGGGLMAGAALGTGVGLMAKKIAATGQNVRNAKGIGGKAKALGAGVVTGGAAVATGMLRGGYKARGAKNFTDMRKASAGGVDATMQTGEKIKGTVDRYKAEGKILPGITAAPQNAGVIIGGFVGDKWDKAKTYLGLSDGIQALQEEQSVIQEGMNFKKKLFDLVADDSKVLTYQGLKKNAQEKDIDSYIKNIETEISALGFTQKDSQGYFKILANGNKEYYKDAQGNLIKDLTYTATLRKTAEIQQYDDAIKAASLMVIHDKLENDDGRFKAVLEASEVYKKQNAGNPNISELSKWENLDATQYQALQDALSSNDAQSIKRVLDAFEGDSSAQQQLGINSLGIMENDKKLKKSNGNIEYEISKMVQEKKKQDSNK